MNEEAENAKINRNESIQDGIRSFVFPIIMMVLGFFLTSTVVTISKTLEKMQEEMVVVKVENRGTLGKVENIDYRLERIEEDVKDIKKSQYDSTKDL